MYPNRSDYVIMSASCLTNNKAITPNNANEIMGHGHTNSILIARRERSYDKYSNVIISGSGLNYEEATRTATYTQDTGNGHKLIGYRLIIENVIEYDAEGNVSKKLNDIGLTQKRRLWVMK